MKKSILIFTLILAFSSAFSQSYLGISGGVIAGDAFIDAVTVPTTYHISPVFGINYSYYPEKNKPGIKFLLTKLNYGFQEITSGGWNIDYSYHGYNFQFLNIMYLPVKSAKVSLQMGPAFNYMTTPVSTGDTSTSLLPEFISENLNTVMLDLEGGVGLSIPAGKFNFETHSVFAFGVSKYFKNLQGSSNPLNLHLIFSVQYQISH